MKKFMYERELDDFINNGGKFKCHNIVSESARDALQILDTYYGNDRSKFDDGGILFILEETDNFESVSSEINEYMKNDIINLNFLLTNYELAQVLYSNDEPDVFVSTFTTLVNNEFGYSFIIDKNVSDSDYKDFLKKFKAKNLYEDIMSAIPDAIELVPNMIQPN